MEDHSSGGKILGLFSPSFGPVHVPLLNGLKEVLWPHHHALDLTCQLGRGSKHTGHSPHLPHQVSGCLGSNSIISPPCTEPFSWVRKGQKRGQTLVGLDGPWCPG